MTEAQEQTAPVEPVHFFISHTGVDRRWAEWLGWQLEDAGYRVILDAWDFRAGTSFVGAMDDAASRAERTLVVASPDYFQAQYTTPEWEAAFTQDSRGETGRLLLVMVRSCELPVLLQPRLYIDLVGLDHDAAKAQLLARVSDQRGKPESEPSFPGEPAGRPPEPRFTGSLPPIWNVPHDRNPNFTGRDDLLDALYASLHAGNATVLRQALRGLGGVGKTQLALEYAYRHAADYSVVWWVPSETSAETVYAELTRDLGLPEADASESEVQVQAVKQWLEQHEGWLLVFDNATEPDSVRHYFPQGQSGHVIITSRYWDWGDVATGLGVEVFDRDAESVPFLLRRTSQSDEAAARALADALGNLPLALAQASTYIATTRRTLATYTELFEKRRDDLWRQEKPPDTYPATVAVTWSLAMEEIAKESPEAADLLYLLAYFAPEPVSHDLLLKGVAYLSGETTPRSKNLFVSLYQRIRQAFDKKPRTTLLGNMITDSVLWDRGMAAFRRYGLVEVTEAGLLVHRLVQVVTRDRLAADERRAWAAAAVRVVNAAYPDDLYSPREIEIWEKCEELLSHAVVTAEYAEALGVALEKISVLLSRVAFYLHSRGRYDETESFYARALDIGKATLSVEHSTVASLISNLASLYRDQGRYDEAESLYEQALGIGEATLGSDHSIVATRLNNFANLYRDQGRYDEAESLYKRALAIEESNLGRDHPAFATLLNNLANLYQDQGRYEGVEALLVRALVIREQSLGYQHSEVGQSLSNLASLYRDQGRYSEAEPLYERALSIGRATLSSDHPIVAVRFNNLASLYRDQGRYSEAEPLFIRALDISKVNLGIDHPTVATLLNNLAGLYKNLGRCDEAESLYKQALAIEESNLGRDHPAVAISLNNLAKLYQDQSCYQEAKQHYQRALAILETALGPDHPSTQTVRGNYDSVF